MLIVYSFVSYRSYGCQITKKTPQKTPNKQTNKNNNKNTITALEREVMQRNMLGTQVFQIRKSTLLPILCIIPFTASCPESRSFPMPAVQNQNQFLYTCSA